MAAIIGHLNQRDTLAELARSDKLPSTLLLTGTKGIGKQLAARELAAQLLCEGRSETPRGGCGSCKSCTLVRSGNHPDLHTLHFGSEDGVSVDDLRRTLEGLSLRAFMGGRKVALFDDIDAISTVGANIILKSLEEPRAETFFILVASNPSRLPQTLLSRCQRWFFDRLSVEEIREIVKARGEEDISDTLAILADGSVSALATIKDRSQIWTEIQETLDKAHRGDTSAVAAAGLAWGSDKNLLSERFTFLRCAIRSRLTQDAADRDAAAVWAHALQNALDAAYLATERHVNPTLCFVRILASCDKMNAAAYQQAPNVCQTLGDEVISEMLAPQPETMRPDFTTRAKHLCFTLLVTVSAGCFLFTPSLKDFESLPLQTPLHHYSIAHRGSLHQGLPDNSLPALKQSIEEGVLFLEVDIRQGSDGTLFLFHDGSLQRENFFSPVELRGRRITDLSADERKSVRLDKGGTLTIPTLKEALNLISDSSSATLQLDLKGESDELLQSVIDLLKREQKLSRTVIQLKDPARIERLRSAEPTARIVARCRNLEELNRAIAARVEFVELERWITGEAVAKCHEANIAVVFNVSAPPYDNHETWQFFRARGVDSIMSDYAVAAAAKKPTP